MKSFVVMTYYQLMHSVAMALSMDEKPALYFSTNYLGVDEDFLDNIRDTGVFEHVVGITGRGELAGFIAELNKTKDRTSEEIDEIGTSIFDKYLEPYYGELFKDADFDDTLYLYNDFQWQSYYIDKHFNDIVGIEDGYGSLEQQLSIHRFKGDHELAIPFLGKYYPEPLYRSPKIKTIISSVSYDNLPREYMEKLQILDFNELVESNADEFRRVMLRIFDMSDYEIKDGGLLILGQPLSRAKYCNSVEEYLFYRKTIRELRAEGYEIYFKGHPAETIPSTVYKGDGVNILPRSFPVELLNYIGCTFDQVITFGSTGVETMACAKGFRKLFGNQGAGEQEINEFICDSIRDEDVVIDFFFIVRELTSEAFVDVYSCFVKEENLKQRTHVIVPAEIEHEAGRFFRKKDLAKHARRYIKTHTIDGSCVVESDIKDLCSRDMDIVTDPEIIVCDDINNDECLFDTIVQNQKGSDYVVVLEENNLAFKLVRGAWKELEHKVDYGMIFQRASEVKNRKRKFPWVSLSPGYIGHFFSSDIANRLLHRVVVERLAQLPYEERTKTMFLEDITLARKFNNTLFIPSEKYTDIENGLEYYAERARRCNAVNKGDEDAIVYGTALELGYYLDWRTLSSDQRFEEAIDEFMEQIELDDDLKTRIVTAFCSTIMFEKEKRFKLSYGPVYERRRYVTDIIGGSNKVLRGVKRMKSIRSKGRR